MKHALVTSLLAGFLLLAAATAPAADFIGAQACGGCHADQTAAWHGSQHDLAMQPATPATVLGDFADASFTKDGVTSRFFREGDRFQVETDGPDGKLQRYAVDYTFGVYPLQQYLVAFPGGRWQALPLAWDARPKEQGGQRWFHLYPDEAIPAGDELHWTGANQNWNWMCADCHSTDLRRNYDLASDSYRTTYAALNVSCEACHGPGSAHRAWAEGGADPAVDDAMRAALDRSLAAFTAIKASADSGQMAYDQMLAEGNEPGNAMLQAAIDALVAQTRTIEQAVAALGLDQLAFEGSDSLDNPEAVFQ